MPQSIKPKPERLVRIRYQVSEKFDGSKQLKDVFADMFLSENKVNDSNKTRRNECGISQDSCFRKGINLWNN